MMKIIYPMVYVQSSPISPPPTQSQSRCVSDLHTPKMKSHNTHCPFFSASLLSCSKIYPTPLLIPSPSSTTGAYPNLFLALSIL